MRRIVSSSIIGCIIVVSPGNGFYSALGQVINQSPASIVPAPAVTVALPGNGNPSSRFGFDPGRLSRLDLLSVSDPGLQLGSYHKPSSASRAMLSKGLPDISGKRSLSVSRPVQFGRDRAGKVQPTPGSGSMTQSFRRSEASWHPSQEGEAESSGPPSVMSDESPVNRRTVVKNVVSIAEALGFLQSREDGVLVPEESFFPIDALSRPASNPKVSSISGASRGSKLRDSLSASAGLAANSSTVPTAPGGATKVSAGPTSFVLSPFRAVGRFFKRPDVLTLLATMVIEPGIVYSTTLIPIGLMGTMALFAMLVVSISGKISTANRVSLRTRLAAFTALITSFSFALSYGLLMIGFRPTDIYSALAMYTVLTAIVGFATRSVTLGWMKPLSKSAAARLREMGRNVDLDSRQRGWLRGLLSYSGERRKTVSDMRRNLDESRVLGTVVNGLLSVEPDIAIKLEIEDLLNAWKQEGALRDVEHMAGLLDASDGNGNGVVAELLERAENALSRMNTTTFLGRKHHRALQDAITALRFASAGGNLDSISVAAKRLEDLLSASSLRSLGFMPALFKVSGSGADRTSAFNHAGLGANSSSMRGGAGTMSVGLGFLPFQSGVLKLAQFVVPTFYKLRRFLSRRPDVLTVLAAGAIGAAMFGAVRLVEFITVVGNANPSVGGAIIFALLMTFAVSAIIAVGVYTYVDTTFKAVIGAISVAVLVTTGSLFGLWLVRGMGLNIHYLPITAMFLMGAKYMPGVYKRMGYLPRAERNRIWDIGQRIGLNRQTHGWLRGLTSYTNERARTISEMKIFPGKSMALRPVVDELLRVESDREIKNQISELADLWEQEAQFAGVKRLSELLEAFSEKGDGDVTKLLDRAKAVLGQIDGTSLLARRRSKALKDAIDALEIALVGGDHGSIAVAAQRLGDQLSALRQQSLGFMVALGRASRSIPPGLGANSSSVQGGAGTMSVGLGFLPFQAGMAKLAGSVAPSLRKLRRFLGRPDVLAPLAVLVYEGIIFGIACVVGGEKIASICIAMILLPGILAFFKRPELRIRWLTFWGLAFSSTLSFYLATRIRGAYPGYFPMLLGYMGAVALLGGLLGFGIHKLLMKPLLDSDRRKIRKIAEGIDLDKQARGWLRGILSYAKERRRTISDMKNFAGKSRVLKPVIEELLRVEVLEALVGSTSSRKVAIEIKELAELWKEFEEQQAQLKALQSTADLVKAPGGEGLNEVARLLDRANDVLGRMNTSSILGDIRSRALQGAIGVLEAALALGNPDIIALASDRLEKCLATVGAKL